jgi:molecular chaperone IbpA
MTKEISLRAIDIPTMHKFGIGFDNMFDELLRMTAQQTTVNYPPHNVIKIAEETILIEVAVAGFKEGDISVVVSDNVLTISGSKPSVVENANYEYYHRGISSRDFSRQFTLADYVEINEATVENGILSIILERKLPEYKKPKQIAIKYHK